MPTIWRDEDWDNSFINEIFIKKLEHTRDFFLSDRTNIAEAKRVANEIQTAIDLLHMTRDSWEFYECPVLEELDAKWGKGVLRTEPYGDNSYQLHIDIDGVKTEADRAQYNEEFSKGMDRARKEYQKDKRTAFKYIADHIDYWWD